MFRKVLFKNFLGIILFSPLRLLLNIFFTSRLVPADYGFYIFFLILYSIAEIFIDFGSRSFIIQSEIRDNEALNSIMKGNFLASVVFSAIFILMAIVQSEISYLLLALIVVCRSLSFVLESVLQLSQRYFEIQFLEFIATFGAISLSIFLLKYGVKSILLVNLLLYVLLYTILLLLRKKTMTITFSGEMRLGGLNEQRLGLFKNQVLDLVSLRSDEYVLSQLVGTSILGVFSKSREIGNTLGGITSKIVSRPFFVQVSRTKGNINYQDKLLMVIGWYASITYALVSFGYLGGLELPLSLIYGENWVVLDGLSWSIVSLSMMYFLTTLRRYFMLGLIRQDDLTIVDIVCLFIRLVSLGFLFYVGYFSINVLLTLELCIRLLSSELMALSLSGIYVYRKSSYTWFNLILAILLIVYYA